MKKVPVYNINYVASKALGIGYEGVADQQAVIVKGNNALSIRRDGKTQTWHGAISFPYYTSEGGKDFYMDLETFKDDAVSMDAFLSDFLINPTPEICEAIREEFRILGLDPDSYMHPLFPNIPKRERGRPAMCEGKVRRISFVIPEEEYNRIPKPASEFIRKAVEEKLK